MPANATGRLPEKPAQKLIHDHDDEDRHQFNAITGYRLDFTAWLKAQRHRSDPVGALSGEMAGDGGWPEPVAYQDALDFLEGHDAPWFVIAALSVAWKEWRDRKAAVAMTTRPFAMAAEHYKAAGWAPIPILGGGKGATPGGVTGHDGVDLEGKRLQDFIRRYGKCVIATRAPVGDGFWTIGIDVDQYGDKHGADTLAAWATEWGPLSPTYVSTSRDDGVSGIRWFKVPGGWRGKANHPSVELVQRWHRQGVMQPSLHETRKVRIAGSPRATSPRSRSPEWPICPGSPSPTWTGSGTTAR
jgi:hypothetical protein